MPKALVWSELGGQHFVARDARPAAPIVTGTPKASVEHDVGSLTVAWHTNETALFDYTVEFRVNYAEVGRSALQQYRAAKVAGDKCNDTTRRCALTIDRLRANTTYEVYVVGFNAR